MRAIKEMLYLSILLWMTIQIITMDTELIQNLIYGTILSILDLIVSTIFIKIYKSDLIKIWNLWMVCALSYIYFLNTPLFYVAIYSILWVNYIWTVFKI
jgi:hypothetical protein